MNTKNKIDIDTMSDIRGNIDKIIAIAEVLLEVIRRYENTQLPLPIEDKTIGDILETIWEYGCRTQEQFGYVYCSLYPKNNIDMKGKFE